MVVSEDESVISQSRLYLINVSSVMMKTSGLHPLILYVVFVIILQYVCDVITCVVFVCLESVGNFVVVLNPPWNPMSFKYIYICIVVHTVLCTNTLKSIEFHGFSCNLLYLKWGTYIITLWFGMEMITEYTQTG